MGLHRWLMCFGQRLRGSRPRRKIGADTLKPRRALGKTWEQAPTAFEAAQLIKPPALRGVSDFIIDGIRIDAREAFHDVEGFTLADTFNASGSRARRNPAFVVVVGGIDNQRIAFPVPARVAVP